MDKPSRNLVVERLFPLGDYKNIKFIDSIDNIQFPLSINNEFISLIRYLQLVEIEITYRLYWDLIKEINTIKVEEAMGYLEKTRLDTLGKIKIMIEEQENAIRKD